MELTQMTITRFCEVLASDAPAPGGGSTAALEGSLGIALTNMVASLTVGKKKYEEYQDTMNEIMMEATRIQSEFVKIIDEDTESFNQVSAVFMMPKNTEVEKRARKEALQKALKGCTYTPYEMMVLATDSLELTKKALGKSNSSAASDLGVAALSLKAAIQGAWLNVLINIDGIEDEEFVKNYRNKGQMLIEKALPLADEIYDHVLADLLSCD